VRSAILVAGAAVLALLATVLVVARRLLEAEVEAELRATPERLLRLASLLLPRQVRGRYLAEWLGDLDALPEGLPLRRIVWASAVAVRAFFLRRAVGGSIRRRAHRLVNVHGQDIRDVEFIPIPYDGSARIRPDGAIVFPKDRSVTAIQVFEGVWEFDHGGGVRTFYRQVAGEFVGPFRLDGNLTTLVTEETRRRLMGSTSKTVSLDQVRANLAASGADPGAGAGDEPESGPR
jgi:hypothetical protein